MENFLLSEEKLETTKDQSKSLSSDVDMFQDLKSENEVINKYYIYFIFKIFAHLIKNYFVKRLL